MAIAPRVARPQPDFCIAGDGFLNRPIHIAIAAKDREAVDAFYRAALAAGGIGQWRTGPAPRIVTPITMPPLFLIPTATTSKPSATAA